MLQLQASVRSAKRYGVADIVYIMSPRLLFCLSDWCFLLAEVTLTAFIKLTTSYFKVRGWKISSGKYEFLGHTIMKISLAVAPTPWLPK